MFCNTSLTSWGIPARFWDSQLYIPLVLQEVQGWLNPRINKSFREKKEEEEKNTILCFPCAASPRDKHGWRITVHPLSCVLEKSLGKFGRGGTAKAKHLLRVHAWAAPVTDVMRQRPNIQLRWAHFTFRNTCLQLSRQNKGRWCWIWRCVA